MDARVQKGVGWQVCTHHSLHTLEHGRAVVVPSSAPCHLRWRRRRCRRPFGVWLRLASAAVAVVGVVFLFLAVCMQVGGHSGRRSASLSHGRVSRVRGIWYPPLSDAAAGESRRVRRHRKEATPPSPIW